MVKKYHALDNFENGAKISEAVSTDIQGGIIMVKGTTMFLMVIFAALAFANTYAFYYLSTPVYNTNVLISIIGEERANLTVTVFDFNGKELWQKTYDAEEYSTLSIDLSTFIKANDDNWGLAIIDSDSLLHVTVLYEDVDYGLFTTDHVVEPIWFYEDAKYYWYSASHVNKGKSETGLILMNPNDEEVDGNMWICDSKGRTVQDLSGKIKPFSAVFFNLTRFIKDDFGFIDIQVDLPIIIGIEHYENGQLWTINNIVSWYMTTDW